MPTAPACLRRSVYAKLRACFLPVVYARGPTHRLFPGRLSDTNARSVPSTLSFDDFLAACQRPLRRSIRVNTLKTSVADFLQLTAPYGWTLTPIPWCEEGFWIERDSEDALPLGSTAEHLSGLFYIQEASSMLPVAALFADGNAPQRVMDVAAAPGSKTTQIAARMNNEGQSLPMSFPPVG